MAPSSDSRRQRIHKLLALAADQRAPHGERETAAERAAELLTREGITAAQLRGTTGQAPPPVVVYPYACSGDGGHGHARSDLAYQVAEAIGCRALFGNTQPQAGDAITIIIGIASDVATIRLLLPLIFTQAERAAASALRRRMLRPADVGAYLSGYGQTVAARLSVRRRTLAEDTGTGASVVLADWSARVQAVFEATFPTVGTVAAHSGNAYARLNGAIAGHTADLGDGLTSTGRRPALPGAPSKQA